MSLKNNLRSWKLDAALLVILGGLWGFMAGTMHDRTDAIGVTIWALALLVCIACMVLAFTIWASKTGFLSLPDDADNARRRISFPGYEPHGFKEGDIVEISGLRNDESLKKMVVVMAERDGLIIKPYRSRLRRMLDAFVHFVRYWGE